MAKRPKRFYEGEGVSDYGSDEGRGSAGTSENVTPSKPKPKIVTKEELAASGLSLRDYMNKQQGLTRRGESSPPASKQEPSSVRRLTQEEGKNIQKASDEDRYMGRLKAASEKAIMQQQNEKILKDYKATQARQKEANQAASLGMDYKKRGGKVSSASSRADGIAQRGKTRGTMAVMCGGGMTKGKR